MFSNFNLILIESAIYVITSIFVTVCSHPVFACIIYTISKCAKGWMSYKSDINNYHSLIINNKLVQISNIDIYFYFNIDNFTTLSSNCAKTYWVYCIKLLCNSIRNTHKLEISYSSWLNITANHKKCFAYIKKENIF